MYMNEEKIIEKLLRHDQRFDHLKAEMRQMRREYLHGQDQIMVILKRLDEERLFTTHWIQRIEAKIGRNTL